ncbi:S41 family peptidase [Winogradskyella sp. J14-2]|uniref:S41 family peptidase n=1 Tax=Winogradskyella sp. J14-2 TaxID=1936080 RepID=UPI0012FC6DF7|nr:S41 family peptidase [Winogradskyella sp. J14-2]
MKKTFLIIILIFFSFNFLTAQQVISETEKLTSLGKIYGFLKYYHPEVGKGKFDWDNEFIKILPAVLKATDKESLSQVYINWIESLGKIEKCKKCDSDEEYFDKNFDLSWTQNTTLFSNELSLKLKFIEKNRNQKENFYVTTEQIGNIKITNEPAYKDLEFPNEKYRLLGLFKYWNIIEYFYPYKYLTDQDWDDVLIEMISKVRDVSTKYEYQNSIRELVAKLDDSHAWISFNDTTKYRFLPVNISNVENQAVVSEIFNDSLAKINDLKRGDIVVKINDSNIESELKNTLKYVSGSNLNFKINRSYQTIFRDTSDTMLLTIMRDGEIRNISTKLYNFNDFGYLKSKSSLKSKSITKSIGYINMASKFTLKEFEEIFEMFSTKKSIIIDLRAYPELKYKMFTRYFNTKDKVFALKYNPDISYPGRFVFDKSIKTGSSRKAFKGKFILLVDNNSLSLSEFTAMAFQTADNIITIGNQTAGADGRNIAIEYLGGYTTRFSGYGIMYPDGTESQRKGVKIDVEIKPTINGLRQGRDEILEKAIEIGNQ